MYIPAPHAETDDDALFAFIAANPLGALVTATATGELVATHIPWVIHRGRAHGTLQGHIARANSEHTAGQTEAADRQALVIFTGADAYISPTWYASMREHGKVVPTWNYVAVHVIGKARFTSDPEFLARHLEQLVAMHENGRPAAWTLGGAPADYIERQMRAIVGVEVAIDRIEGKWKMSQNRSAEDVAGVVENLRNTSGAKERAVADIVAARNAAKLNGEHGSR
jgi:transcriptional regulator